MHPCRRGFPGAFWSRSTPSPRRSCCRGGTVCPAAWRRYRSAAAFALVSGRRRNRTLPDHRAPRRVLFSASSPNPDRSFCIRRACARCIAPLPSPASSSPVPRGYTGKSALHFAGGPGWERPLCASVREQDSPPADIPAPAAPEDAEAGSTSTGAKALPQSDSGSSGAPFSYGTQPAAEAPGTSSGNHPGGSSPHL